MSVISSIARFDSWILVLTVTGYPIVAATSLLLGIENRPLSIAMRAILVAISVVAITWMRQKRVSRRAVPFWLAWWGFWGLYLLRIALDSYYNPAALKIPATEYFLFAIGTCVIPAVAAFASVRQTTYTPAILLIAASLAIALNLNILIFDVSGSTQLGQHRLETEFLNPIAIGHLGVTALLISLWIVLESAQLSMINLLALLVVSFAALVVIVLGASRGPVIAFAGAALAYFVLRRSSLFNVRLGLLALAVIMGVAYVDPQLEDFVVITRLEESAFKDDAREELLSGAVKLIIDSPLMGAGIEPLYTYPHNMVIESFMVNGILSGLSFCYILFIAVRSLVYISRRDPGNLWLGMLFIQYAISGMFTGSIYMNNAFWVLSGLVIATATHHRSTRPRRPDPIQLGASMNGVATQVAKLDP